MTFARRGGDGQIRPKADTGGGREGRFLLYFCGPPLRMNPNCLSSHVSVFRVNHSLHFVALLHCALAAAQCIVIGPVCGFVAGCVCVCFLFVGGSVTTITRNRVHRSSPNWVCR